MKKFALSVILASAVMACHSTPLAAQSGGAIEKRSSGKATDDQSQSVSNGAKKNAQTRVTGTYYYKGGGRLNEMQVRETAGGELRVTFAGMYEYTRDGEWMNDAGGAGGVITAKLKGNSAVLQIEEYPDCRIALKFAGAKLIVKQEGSSGDCGFAGAVYAYGVYIKRSSDSPDFSREWSIDEYENLPDTIPSAGNIRFAAGASSATVSGKLSEIQPEVAYLVRARKGQNLEIKMAGDVKDKLAAYIVLPDGSRAFSFISENDVSTWRVKLPQKGDYKIVIYANDEENANYKMTVTIH
ncbi:MAG: hypothetical protein M3367_04735 [Acidobacteriota bacterium]|nr:hypothetical protein [Acidobacteriota bacterium]